MAITHFDDLINRFLRLIEHDRDFFELYNVSFDTAVGIARERATGYIYDAIDIIYDYCTPDIDFYDYDDECMLFNFEFTRKEIGLMAKVMRQVYFERDLAKLGAFKIALTPSDLNQFSPATERRTFTDMVAEIKQDVLNEVTRYASIDRETGKRKMIDHSQYTY